jgi:hypothetical protein
MTMGQNEKYDNEVRAKWADIAVKAFTDELSLHDEDKAEIISDLLCDLMHLCRFEKIDWFACVAQGQKDFNEEVEEEKYDWQQE